MYTIIYSKTQPMTAVRETLELARELAAQLEAAGYAVDIWERSESGTRRVIK